MENCYGVGVKNRYELFYDEELDPLEILRQKEVENEKSQTDKGSPTEKSKHLKSNKTAQTGSGFSKIKNVPSPTTQKSPDSSTAISDPKKVRNKPLIEQNARHRNFEGSNDYEKRNFPHREENGHPRAEYKERDGEIRRGRGGFRGRGRGRGRGSFSGGFDNRPPRRDFDRQNGNERRFRSEDKREVDASKSSGYSKDNSIEHGKAAESSTWMDEEPPKNDNSDSNWGETPENNAENVEKGADTSDETTESKETVLEETKDGAKEMTLDEWKQQQQSKRVVPKYNLRKPGEGEDAKQWKKGYILKKKVKSDGEEEEDDEDDEDESTRRGRQRQLVDIQINFNDSRRSRGRGRGGGSFAPRAYRGSFAPRGERGSFAPRGERGSFAPRGERGSFAPRGERGSFAPRGERGSYVPRGERGSFAQRGGSFASRGERGSFGAKDEHEEWGTFTGASVGQSYRGGMKIKSGQQSAPRVDDWNDFPSLVTA